MTPREQVSAPTTLSQDIDGVARLAIRIADERIALMKLVNRAIATSPHDYVAWDAWIDEANEILEGFQS